MIHDQENMSGLVLNDLKFSQGDFDLESGISLAEGELGCLLGPSGSGKTTMLRLIAGFERPESGIILLKNREITEEPPEKRKLGIVFQDYALFPHISVEENIIYGIKASGMLRGLTRAEARDRFKSRTAELLDLVHLNGFENRQIASLSGGEQQRIALARALAPEPDLLLLDEPLSALDVQLRAALRREIKRIQETIGLTTLYITHDQEEALALSDRLFIMKGGRVVESGTPEKLYTHPENLFTGQFLGISNSIPRKNGTETLFFRPEDCIPLESTDPPGENELEGRVIQSEFRGASRLLLLMVEGQEVRLFVPPEIQTVPGRCSGLK